MKSERYAQGEDGVTVEGAQMLGQIWGYLSTLKKQGLNVLEALKQVF